MKHYIGIDLGGTNLAAGLVREDGALICKKSIPTGSGRPAGEIIADMAELAVNTAGMGGYRIEDIQAVGIGVPGTANKETGVIEFANNLGFYDVPLVERISRLLPGPSIMFDNDANAAAWGEYLAGSGKGSRSMVMVTLGTGIGGGIILNGELYEGINYAAGEFGHFVIDIHGAPCNCGRKGCFENYASASALVEQTKRAMERDMGSVLWSLCKGSLDNADGKVFFEAVKKKDATALMVLEEYLFYLGTGLVDLVNTFQPEILCIGGGISKGGDLLLQPLKRMIEKENYARTAKRRTKVVLASLGNDAGLVGSALLR